MHKFIILAAITILATSCQLAGIFTAGNKVEVGGKEATFVKEGYSVPVFSGEEFGGTDLPDVNGKLMFQTYGADKKTNYYSVYVVNPGTLKLKYKLTADNASEYFIGANGDTVSEGAWSDVKKTVKIPFSLKEGADKKDIKFNLSVWSSMRSYEITQPDKIHINNRPPVIYPVADSSGTGVTAEWKPVFNGTNNTSTIYWKYNSAGHTDIKRFKVIYSVAGNDSEAYVDYVNDTQVYSYGVGDISNVTQTVEFAIFAYDTEGLDSGYVATGTFTPKQAPAPTITRGTGANYNKITVTAADGTTLSSVTLNGTQVPVFTAGDSTVTFNLDSAETNPQTVSATAVRSGYINGTATDDFIYDKDPPPDVTDLTTVTGDAKVTLNWTVPGTDDSSGFKEYQILQNGTQIETISNIETKTYTVSGLTNGTQYTFTIITVDNAEHTSTGKTVKATPLDLTAAREMKPVTGGTNVTMQGYTISLSPFEIGKYEVTKQLWATVINWARGKGYSFDASGDNGNQPAWGMRWDQIIVWCNAYTEWYNAIVSPTTPLTFVYYSDAGFTSHIKAYNSIYSDSKGSVHNPYVNPNATGFRLPTEAEWEFAAHGGLGSGDDWNYAYAGSDDINEVAWWNTGDWVDNFANPLVHPHDVGGKKPNRLGLYDMSGNVNEFLFDSWNDNYSELTWTNNDIDPVYIKLDQPWKTWRGGCTLSAASGCKVDNHEPRSWNITGYDTGFRVARWLTGGTVTFNSNGGGTVSSQKIRKNGLVTKPTDPTKSGYVFTGWYKDNTFATEWNFTTDRVSADMTLYARLLENYVQNYDFSAGTDNWGIVNGSGGSIVWPTAYKSFPAHNYAFAAAGGDLVFGDYTSTVSQIVTLPNDLSSKSKITISIHAASCPSGTDFAVRDDDITVSYTCSDASSTILYSQGGVTKTITEGFSWYSFEIDNTVSHFNDFKYLTINLTGNEKGGWAGNYGAVIDKVIVAAE